MSENEDIAMSNATKETEEVVEKETSKEPLPEFVEINDSFDSIEIDTVLEKIAKTNELEVTWEELQPKLESLIAKVNIAFTKNFQKTHVFFFLEAI